MAGIYTAPYSAETLPYSVSTGSAFAALDKLQGIKNYHTWKLNIPVESRKGRLQVQLRSTQVPTRRNPSDWLLADAFDDEVGKLIAGSYHEQHPTKPSPERLVKEWERHQVRLP